MKYAKSLHGPSHYLLTIILGTSNKVSRQIFAYVLFNLCLKNMGSGVKVRKGDIVIEGTRRHLVTSVEVSSLQFSFSSVEISIVAKQMSFFCAL
jgi:hypothetical protein